MKLITLSIAMCMICTLGFSQLTQNLAESNFYSFPASHNSQRVNILNFGAVRNDGGNDTQAVNAAIDAVNSSGGGSVFIPNGTFHLNNVVLKSNVRILVSPNAILKPFKIASQNASTFTFVMFQIGQPGFAGQVAIHSDSATENFTIDFRGSPYVRSRAFQLADVQNFYISGVTHFDNKSVFPTLNLTVTGPDANLKAPRRGVIKNMVTTNTISGYGLIQMQAATNVLFKNLTCTGGIALRLESDYTKNSFRPAAQQRKINRIFGRNIRCTDGQAAVQLSPHTIKQGVVDIRNINAVSCEYALKIEGGFTTKAEVDRGLTPGNFNSNSYFDGITATWGSRSQVRAVFLRFVTCGVRNLIRADNNANENNSFIAPSLAPVLMFERGNQEKVNGFYGVKIGNINRNGFSSQVPNIVRDFCADDYSCGAPTGGISIFEPPICRNNGSKQLQLDQNSTKGISPTVTPNPATTHINVAAVGNSILELYSINNKKVLSQQLEGPNSEVLNTNEINISHLKAGIYFAKIQSGQEFLFQKLIIR